MSEILTLTADVPAEPPTRSVVLDAESMAWQRHANRWIRCGTIVPAFALAGPPDGLLPWNRLITEHGPLTLVYREDEQ